MRIVVVSLLLCLWAGLAAAEVTARIGLILVDEPRPIPISRLEIPAENDALAGAEVGVADNATTGRFLGHTYELVPLRAAPEEALATLKAARAEGIALFVVAASADRLLALADAAPDALLLNMSAPDTALRRAGCRANLFHIPASRAMKADGLAQYLVWKKWERWALIHGSHPDDIAMAEAYRQAAAKFGARIAEELVYEDTGGARRSDSGHVLVQRQIPVFTQNLGRHDVIVVADESEVFAPYLPYRTWDPRPIAGDAGLRVRDWHPAHESWGATQLQRRFEAHAGRRMSDRDYLAWLSVRILGEAVTRTNAADAATLRAFLRSDAFEIAGFKGQALTFRPWNQQLRQGVLLADGPLVVSVSPQEEFLHQRTRLDTLGLDQTETECALAD